MKVGKQLKEIKKIILSFACVLILFLSTIFQGSADGAVDVVPQNTHKEAIERMRAGFEAYDQSIDISDLSIAPEELTLLFSHAIKDTPYLFYVSSTLEFNYYTGGCVIAVKPKYNMEKEEAEEAVLYCKSEIQKMSALVRCRNSELDCLIAVHDLLCRDFSYDLTLENDDLYSFLTQKKGTCQSYTWAYMAILRELGIECRYIASDTLAHIWLSVKIDGEWYNSDVTWDDPTRLEGSSKKSHAHILFSDEKAESDGYKDRYSAEKIQCGSELYDGGELLEDYNFCTLLGDMDHDGKISVSDLLYLSLYIEKGIASKHLCLICADRDKNYTLNENDAELIRQAVVRGG